MLGSTTKNSRAGHSVDLVAKLLDMAVREATEIVQIDQTPMVAAMEGITTPRLPTPATF